MPNEMSRTVAPRAYLTSAVFHPVHMAAIAGVVLFSFLATNLVAAAVAVALEVLYLRFIPRAKRFRRAVEKQVEAAAQRERIMQRDRLKGQMDEVARRRLMELEAVVDRIRDQRRQQPSIGPAAGPADPMELVDAWIDLTVTKQSYEQLLSRVQREGLSCHIIRLQRELETSLVSQVRWIEERRLSIVRRRAALWDRTWADVDRICHQLAAIEELLELLHEQAIVSLAATGAEEQADDMLRELDDRQAIDRELARLTSLRGEEEHRLPS